MKGADLGRPRMPFDQALRVLGVDREAGPREARRAYLALLQRHGPEPSPEVYRTLTAAWETLSDPAAWERPERPRGGRAQGAPPVDERVVVRPGAERPRPAESAEQPRTPRNEQPPPGPAQGTDTSKHAVERVAARHGAVDGPALLAALRSGSTDEVAQRLHSLARRGHVAAARDATVAVLGLMAKHPDRVFLEPRAALRVVLKLQEQAVSGDEALAASRDLQDAVATWRTTESGKRATRDPGTTDRLRWCRDLVALPSDFPTELRVAMARAVGQGVPAAAGPAFRDWAGRNRRRVEGVRALLEAHASSLLALYRHHLDPPEEAPRRAATTRRARRPGSRGSDILDTLRRWSVPSFLAIGAVAAGLWLLLERATGTEVTDPALLASRADICGHVEPEDHTCVLADVVAKAITDADCVVLERAVPQLEGRMRQMVGPAALVRLGKHDKDVLRARVRLLRERYTETCAAAAPSR